MMTKILNKYASFLDKEIKLGIKWFHIHLLALAIGICGLFVLLAGGFAVYKQLGASYFKYRCIQYYGTTCIKHTGFKAILVAPNKHKKVPFSVAEATYTPSSWLINLQYLPKVANQDGLGACQSFSVLNYQLPYIINRHEGRKWKNRHNKPIRLSSRFAYDYVSNGVDAGSSLWGIVKEVNSIGVPLWKQFPYGTGVKKLYPNINAYAVENRSQIPGSAYQEAKVYNVTINNAFTYPGAGMNGVNNLKALIAQFKTPANLDIPVYPGFDNAALTHGVMAHVIKGQTPRGNHSITVIGYNDNLRFKDVNPHEVGYFIAINQWGTNFGGTVQGKFGNGKNGGYIYLPYSFVAKYGWGAAVLSINWPGPTAPSYKTTSPPPLLIPPPLVRPPSIQSNHVPWYVKNVYTRDLGAQNVDLAPYINALGDKYGVSPVGMTAILLSECGLNTGNGNYTASGIVTYNDDCSRYNGVDTSFGDSQFIPPTAGAFGIGDGSYSSSNINYVHWYENHPAWGVYLLAQLVHQYQNMTGLGFPYIDTAYNCGPGWSTYQLENPYSISYSCGSNHDHFLSWWDISINQYGTYTKPYVRHIVKKYFPLAVWNAYRLHHHEHTISPYYHGKLSWIASIWENHTYLGGIKLKEQWNRKGGYTHATFARGEIYTWPRYKKFKITRLR